MPYLPIPVPSNSLVAIPVPQIHTVHIPMPMGDVREQECRETLQQNRCSAVGCEAPVWEGMVVDGWSWRWVP